MIILHTKGSCNFSKSPKCVYHINSKIDSGNTFLLRFHSELLTMVTEAAVMVRIKITVTMAVVMAIHVGTIGIVMTCRVGSPT